MSATEAEASEPRRFFFVHLHKTAGTTVWTRLAHHFDEQQMYPASFDGSPLRRTVSVEDLVERWPQRSADVRVVAGHFPLCTRELLEGGHEMVPFTMLREPVDRIVSALRELRQKVPEFAHASFEQIYDDPLRGPMLRNHMVKMLAMQRAEMTDGFLTQIEMNMDRVDAAIEGLDACDLVGFQDDVEGFCDQLSARYGWNLGEPVRANVSGRVEVPDALLDRIREENQPDIAFYAAARARDESGQRTD